MINKYVKCFVACFAIGVSAYYSQETFGMRQQLPSMSNTYTLKMQGADGTIKTYEFTAPVAGSAGYYDGEKMLVALKGTGFCLDDQLNDVFCDKSGNVYIGNTEITNDILDKKRITKRMMLNEGGKFKTTYPKVNSTNVGSFRSEVLGNGFIAFQNILKSMASGKAIMSGLAGYFDGEKMLVVLRGSGFCLDGQLSDVFCDKSGKVYIGNTEITNDILDKKRITKRMMLNEGGKFKTTYPKVNSTNVGSFRSEVLGNGFIAFQNILKGLKPATSTLSTQQKTGQKPLAVRGQTPTSGGGTHKLQISPQGSVIVSADGPSCNLGILSVPKPEKK